jgi:hypothetical protein
MPHYRLAHPRLYEIPNIHGRSRTGAREQRVRCILLLADTQGPIKSFLYLGLRFCQQ